MGIPSNKSPALAELLDIFGRTDAIKADRCVPAPVGCGGPALEFRDALSAKEYTISGLCQRCQDSVFGGGDES